MPKGTVTINFGAFPGNTEAVAQVTGQGSILAGSLAEAMIIPVATSDHSTDEHIMASAIIDVQVGAVIAGTGFPIHAFVRDRSAPLRPQGEGRVMTASATAGQNAMTQGSVGSVGGEAQRVHGQFTLGWVWD